MGADTLRLNKSDLNLSANLRKLFRPRPLGMNTGGKMILRDIARRNARRHPQRTAVVFGDIAYSFKEFNERVNSIANALLDLGVGKGDRVAILSRNCHQYLELYFAAPKGGMVLVPLNWMLSGPELRYIINDSEANTLFVGQDYVETVNSIRPELKGVKNFIAIGQPSAGMTGYEDLVSRYPSSEPEVEVYEEDTAYLLYTSGTTGLPKGVLTTNRSIVETAINSIFSSHLSPDDVDMALFPLYIGAQCFTLPHVYLGCSVIILNEPTPQAILETIEREKVTIPFISGAHILALLQYPDRDKYDLSSVRRIVFGGAPLPVEVWKQAISVFGNILASFYGLSEGSPLAFLSPEEVIEEGPPEKMRRLQSSGREAMNVEVRIIDEDDRDVPPGEVGELIAKSDILMKGYWKLPQATAETLKGGYLRTGDLASMDEERYIYLVDRKKDVITSGGETVYPRDIEEVLYRHPSVLEAAVIGVPDEKLGEAVKAIVVLREGERATEKEIIEFCQQSLADYATPSSVEFTDMVPRNPSGKVLRRELREKYGNG